MCPRTEPCGTTDETRDSVGVNANLPMNVVDLSWFATPSYFTASRQL